MIRLSFALALVTTGALLGTAQADLLRCHGTEPFWNLEISGDGIFLQDYSSDDWERRIEYRNVPETRTEGSSTFEYRTTNLETGAAAVISVTPTPGQCSNGMSDEMFDYSVRLVDGGFVRTGCCQY